MQTGILLSNTYEGRGRFSRGQGSLSRRGGRASPLEPRAAAGPLRGRVHRLPAARGAAGQAPGPAVALPDADLHPGRAAHDRGASRPPAAARRVRRPARRPALRPRPDHARGRAVRHPGGAAAAGRAGAARPAGRRARRPRPARGGRPRRRVRRAAREARVLRRAGLSHAGLSWAADAAVAPEVSWAWRELLREGGATRVSELAAWTGWSERHLTSRFRTEIGLAPKAAARVVRFDRARKLLVRKLT